MEIVGPEHRAKRTRKTKRAPRAVDVKGASAQSSSPKAGGGRAEEVSEVITGENSPKLTTQQTRYPGRSENAKPGEREALSAPSGLEVPASVSTAQSSGRSTGGEGGGHAGEEVSRPQRHRAKRESQGRLSKRRKHGGQAKRSGVSRRLLSKLVK